LKSSAATTHVHAGQDGAFRHCCRRTGRCIKDHRLYAAYHLIALRGLRRGEAAGLRWQDVDLDGKTATISQQLQQHGGRLVVCPPKTPDSVRVIALDHTPSRRCAPTVTASAPRLPQPGTPGSTAGTWSPARTAGRWLPTG
jgi:integrase